MASHPNGVEICPTTGKHSYQTRGEARAAGRGFNASGRNKGQVSVYRCRGCGFWHLGRR